jgi:hypothetical protein
MYPSASGVVVKTGVASEAVPENGPASGELPFSVPASGVEGLFYKNDENG